MNLLKNIRTTAINVFQNEANALLNLIPEIGDEFETCVKDVLKSKGRVVITGIGKSAIVANKIVATLNSTGTPSLFMHAADAIHGDLGMIKKEDFVICISKSGNTPEIKLLVPMLKTLGSKLIGLVGNKDSYLAKHSDYVLFTGIEEEACPNNLAPTTSTTVQMAMGDALAICLLTARGFTAESFARFHPGGTLGKQLYLKVKDVIDASLLPMVEESASLKEVVLEISSKRLGATAVVDAAQNLRGIITDGDLRRMLQNNFEVSEIKAGDIMTKNPKTILLDDFAVKAVEVMRTFNITQLVVKDNSSLVGFVHIHDLMKEGIV
ncbi:KpsF/GutQ family sugar-phosphate isomerase [Cyclobacterium marinum]|uniref:KpsF/GutQ family protein n=1 Tax=Cyclobacterium marinum (strain ATCC 25205 / DSM 745 / LMG 13164 / NCIMB 1802) TaxID=880070 RepID=G0J195_CYCMS|nr:KpsF/GutQ family sugar-phosphate isomerase [Cyclobacterium marinum]AEL26534.1 KpsF/GutQ family protein [Cyclobacterium marinum DSM 745]MBI0399864.1 KpsF/GutQ family sugar-phosphate isomerase [Cyclobacterium marinum]